MANVLLVDDDPDIGDVLRDALCALGHSTRLARNGQEGLACVRDESPDLIISDVEMPITSGPDMALEIFRHDAGLELIPILLISGCRDLRHIAEHVGTPYFLVKPFSVGKLAGMLDHALAERRSPHPNEAAQGPR